MNPRNKPEINDKIWFNIMVWEVFEYDPDKMESEFQTLMSVVHEDENGLPFYRMTTDDGLKWKFICNRAVDEYPAFHVFHFRNIDTGECKLFFRQKKQSKEFAMFYAEYLNIFNLMQRRKPPTIKKRKRYEELHGWLAKYD